MAIIIPGKTKCWLCEKVIRESPFHFWSWLFARREQQDIIAFPAFLPHDHKLAHFSDAAFHKECFGRCAEREVVEKLHAQYQSIWNQRPRYLETFLEIENWYQEAFKDFPPKEENTDWDRKHVHYCVESYQSCQDVTVACNKKLSTWAASDLPWKQSGNEYGTSPSPEKDLGYSFDAAQVTCPECRAWMESHLNKCEVCGEVAVYSCCRKCAIESLIKEEAIKVDEKTK